MMDISIDAIIQINRGILKEWLEENPSLYEGIAVNNDRLNEVIEIIKQQEDLILKASYLMGGIAWAQPFSGGNKRTGVVCADTFLRMNGYRLDVKTEEDIEYMKKLLFEIQEERASLNVETMAKIILYVAKRIVKL